jgi:hypothetical protein
MANPEWRPYRLRHCGQDYFLYLGNVAVQIYRELPDLDHLVIEDIVEDKDEPDYVFVFDKVDEVRYIAGTAGTPEGLKDLRENEECLGSFVLKHGFGPHVEIDDKPIEAVLEIYTLGHSYELDGMDTFPSEWNND